MYWTYAIVEPATRLFVYVGQTNNFERRKAEHLKPPRTRKTSHPEGSIKEWLADAYTKRITPSFMVLETVETEEESLLSESKWIEKLAAIGHPLLNRWEEHQELIKAGAPPPADTYEAFWPDKWQRSIAMMEPTPKKAGFSLTFPEDTTVRAGGRLVILPTREDKA